MRDHDPVVIDQFNGWWNRDDDVSAPLDHFNQADNIRFFASGMETRFALDKYQFGGTPLDKILRVYNYVTQVGQTLLVLVEGGIIYHVTSTINVPVPMMNVPGMTDFGFVAIAGRAYITPFTSYVDNNGQSYELGLPNEYLYVYNGDGNPARRAGGVAPSNANLSYPNTPTNSTFPNGEPPFLGYNDSEGVVTKGIHVIGISFNDGTGFRNMGPISDHAPTLVPPFANHSMFPTVNAPGNQRIQLNNIPIGPPGTTQRMINMTHAIDPNSYKYNDLTVPYYVVEILLDNTTTTRFINQTDANLATAFSPTIGSPFFISHAMQISDSDDPGFSDIGFHLVGVVYETNTGYMTSPGPEYYAANTINQSTKSIMVLNIPVSTDPNVVRRHLVSTKAIPNYNGDQKGYQFYFIPKGTLNDNTTRAMEVSYYDSDLLSDASHLMDNFAKIPAGVALNTYHSRLVLVGDPTIPPAGTTLTKNPRDGAIRPDNRSVAWISAPGEPEAISQVDGLIVTPLDGNPLTNCQEFRDALYLFKSTRTYAYVDNQDEPSTWQEKVIDEGVGAPVHGIGTVLDSGGVNVDFLLICDWSGLMLFNGVYSRPEMSWKIENYWMRLDRNGFRYVQIVNDSIGKKIYITLPPPLQNSILYADYGNGLDAKNIRWAKWIFDGDISGTCLIDSNKVILTADKTLGGIYYINRTKTPRHDSYNNSVEKKIPDPTIRTTMFGD